MRKKKGKKARKKAAVNPGKPASDSHQLTGNWWPALPAAAALIGGIIASLTAPSIPPEGTPPPWFAPFFGTSAGVIATLFVTLALGARQIKVNVGMAWFTVSYIGLGEVAAVAGLSGSLPHGAYAVLLGLTVGAGLGALLSSIIIGGTAISIDEAARRRKWLEEISGR
jgi:hypothetical protein